MARIKYAIIRQLTIAKIFMSVGALWIIIYGILVTNKIIENKIYGWHASGITLVLIGLFYILIPFSTKSGWWSRTWAILLTIISLIIVIGFFVGKNVDYQWVWTYLEAMPHLLMAIGAIFWIIQA